MRQVDGMKERELTRGDLADTSWMFFSETTTCAGRYG